jgi:molecular chaperone GrpE
VSNEKKDAKNSDEAHDLDERTNPVVELDDMDDSQTVVTEAPKVAELQQELDKARNNLLYLGAEFENYKRQAIKERSELSRFGAERFIRDLLEVVDNFERALAMEVNPSTVPAFREGVTLIHRELQSLLSRHGVNEVGQVGQPFDPNLHEAVTSEVTEQVPPGAVSKIFKRAYRLHDRLLRPAQVVVAKAPETKKS